MCKRKKKNERKFIKSRSPFLRSSDVALLQGGAVHRGGPALEGQRRRVSFGVWRCWSGEPACGGSWSSSGDASSAGGGGAGGAGESLLDDALFALAAAAARVAQAAAAPQQQRRVALIDVEPIVIAD